MDFITYDVLQGRFRGQELEQAAFAESFDTEQKHVVLLTNWPNVPQREPQKLTTHKNLQKETRNTNYVNDSLRGWGYVFGKVGVLPVALPNGECNMQHETQTRSQIMKG
eukprot:2759012-Amphidinium_carterae.1